MVETAAFGKTGLMIPSMVFGSSDLGNLYRAMTWREKYDIIKKCVDLTAPRTVFDSAGKYGAGLALEVLGECLHQLNIPAEEIIISNKLGWVRSPLLGSEPTFEPGVWKDIRHDAVQRISYKGILDCFEEGNHLLKHYTPQLVSVHDPDEYLAAAKNPADEQRRFDDILEAYRALQDLKKQGLVAGIGVGVKDWRVIPRIFNHVDLDWVMVANSLTIYQHPQALLDFIELLRRKQVGIINAAVFQGGFLVGGDHFNYRLIRPNTPENKGLLSWRQSFFEVCQLFDITPSHACIQFGLSVPGVSSVALSTADQEKVSENFNATQVPLPPKFWDEMKNRKLISNLNFL
jgi:D-threo-aldose 1-dehydrogenase